MVTPAQQHLATLAEALPALAPVQSVGELLIRRMRSEDVPGVMTIEAVSFGKHHWAEESFLNEMNNQLGRYFVLLNPQSSEVLGYCGYWMILDEAHITTIAVYPKCRGLSLGEVELVHMLDRMMGTSIKWATLEVRASNYSAQNLYYKYGFKSAGLRRKYYQDNEEDALIMTTPDITSAAFRALYNERKQALVEKLGALPQGFGQG